MITVRDNSFSSDADTVCEVGLSKRPFTVKAANFKFDDRLSSLASVSDLTLALSSDKGEDVFRSSPRSGRDDLATVTKYFGNTNFSEDGSLTSLAPADTSF